mmetsp:Transcript_19306/g.42071  ORF Transcript_19306/g.42071 Transcript_19306/m.42071 type:complete len:538 (-) Transcript_19306:143-1756(-)
MGAAASEPEDLIPLPQQQIVTVSDGNFSSASQVVSMPGGRVGSSKQARGVRPPIVLARGGLHLGSDGTVAVQVDASVEGSIELLAPALEYPSCQEAADDGSDEAREGMWPEVKAAFGLPSARRFSGGGPCAVRFDQHAEVLRIAKGGNAVHRVVDGGCVRWPLVLELLPGGATSSANPPPNGSQLVFCSVLSGQLKVEKQLVAWDGKSWPVRELFGLQESQQAPASTSERDCVVCYAAAKDTALLPCGHFCVCYSCARELRLSPARNRCPLCRQSVHDIEQIDFTTREAAVEPTQVGHGNADDGSSLPAAPVAGAARDSEASPGPQEPAEVATAAAQGMASGAAQGTAQSTASPGAGPLPPRCLQRLSREVRQVEEQREKSRMEHGVELSLVDEEGGDLRIWSLKILAHGVDADSHLGKQLRAHSINAICFEVWIPDNFPVEPPRVRVLRPNFTIGSFFVQSNGALCLEILTSQGWSPAMSLLQLAQQVKAMMSQGSGNIHSAGGDDRRSDAAARDRAWATQKQIEAVHTDWDSFNS